MKETMEYIEEHGFDYKMIHGNLIVQVWDENEDGTNFFIWYHIESLDELKELVGDED